MQAYERPQNEHANLSTGERVREPVSMRRLDRLESSSTEQAFSRHERHGDTTQVQESQRTILYALWRLPKVRDQRSSNDEGTRAYDDDDDDDDDETIRHASIIGMRRLTLKPGKGIGRASL